MKLEKLKGKRILIVGYGLEGKSVESYLKKNVAGVTVEKADKKDGPHYLEKQNEYDLVIKSPGVKKSLITIPYTTATNIFFANCKNMIIGITGTKGKSTTASLIHHILISSGNKSHLVGNIGTPAIKLLNSPLKNDEIIVMELSSYQTEDICYSPHFIVFTSLFPEHMNYHGSVDLYYEAKRNILTYLRSNDVVFFNSKYDQINKWLESVDCKKTDVSNLSLGDIKSCLIGKHNYENILLAYAVAKEIHISDFKILSALLSYKPLSHRLEKVGEYKGILFYDDAISTIPQSTIAAIDSLETVDTLFLGGQDRGYDFSQLVERIVKSNISNIVLFPDSGEKIFKLLKKQQGNLLNILKTDSMKDAVAFAFEHTKKGYTCLLSTASPSYSLWKNYIEKGNLFKKCILNYEKN